MRHRLEFGHWLGGCMDTDGLCMESHVDITCHRPVQMHEGVSENWHEHITLTNAETGLYDINPCCMASTLRTM